MNPCRGCNKRTIGCHSTCLRRAVWEALHEVEKRQDRLQRATYISDEDFKKRTKSIESAKDYKKRKTTK